MKNKNTIDKQNLYSELIISLILLVSAVYTFVHLLQ